MLRMRLLLFSLASILAGSSARIEYEENGNWAEQKPFQIIMSWYLAHAHHAVAVQVVHSKERGSMYQTLSTLIPEIHKKSGIAIFITHHALESVDHRTSSYRYFGQKKSSSNTSTTHQASDASVLSEWRPLPASNSDWQNLATYGDRMTILLIHDEAAFREFSNSGGFRRRNRVRLLLIVVVPEPLDILCEGIPEKRVWKESVRNIMERIWSEYKVLNIFLSAPTSSCIKDYIFSWNPFAKRSNSFVGELKMLKITADDPNADRALSKFSISLKNMNGYPLKVTIFERLPTVLATSDGGRIHQVEENNELDIHRITGMDGIILKTLSSSLNCTVELHPPSGDSLYGYQLENGTFVGMLGDIVYRRTDFSANGVFLKDYGTGNATEFTVPISCESMCIAVPRAGEIPQWQRIFQCFSPVVWNLLFLNVLIHGLLRHILCKLLRERNPRRNLLEVVIQTALIFVGSPENLPKLHSERILVGFYVLFSVIIVGSFQGTLYEGFTNPEYYVDINTLADLDSSGLTIGTGSPNLLNIFGEDDDSPILNNLRQKVKIVEGNWGTGSIDRAAWKQDIAAIERKNDLKLSIDTKFLDEHGEKVLHVVQECPRNYHLTFIVPSDAFFLPRMNILLYRMVESGLVPYWYNSTVQSLIMKSHYAMAKKLKLKDKAVPFNLKNLQISFIVLTSGLLLSILVFIGEIFIFRRKIPRGRTISKIISASKDFTPPF